MRSMAIPSRAFTPASPDNSVSTFDRRRLIFLARRNRAHYDQSRVYNTPLSLVVQQQLHESFRAIKESYTQCEQAMLQLKASAESLRQSHHDRAISTQIALSRALLKRLYSGDGDVDPYVTQLVVTPKE